MRCEQYRKFVIEAVLGELDREALAQFETHRASCQACQADFCRVRELLDSIDRGVMDMLDVQPSAKFGAQVRQRLSESSAEQRLLPQLWVPAAAGGLAVIAVLALLFSFKSSLLHEPNSLQGSAQVAEKQLASSPIATAIVSEPHPSAYKMPVRRVRPLKSKHERSESKQSIARLMPAVVVPPREWAAVTRLAADVSSGRVSLDPISITIVQSVEPTEIVSSGLPVFEVVSMDEQDHLSDWQNR
jgi:hypothetical protein